MIQKGDTRSEGELGAGAAPDAPFEWLTNFRSLRHLLLPSRIVGRPPSSLAPGSETHHDDQPPVRLNALHVGCGTSTAGEGLLRLAESAGGRALRYGRVLNVDNDRRALESMRRRWEERRGVEEAASRSPRDKTGTIAWRHLDFGDEASCRSTLDGEHRQLLPPGEAAEEDAPGGGFDLVLDKSTLDCLLCAETEVVARFLCEVYRTLRVPDDVRANDDRRNDSTNADFRSTWGGIYVLVTFHPVEFVERMLTGLPGAFWSVEHESVKREAEVVSGGGSGAGDVDEGSDLGKLRSQPDDDVRGDSRPPPPAPAWSSGTFLPDEGYRRTVNVFTCRRCRPRSSSEAGASPSPSYVLDGERVRQHVEDMCNDWFQTVNPMVTEEREGDLRAAFSKAAGAAMIRSDCEVSTPENFVADLKMCYEILFTDAEKEHLSYDYFLEDWDAYCKSVNQVSHRAVRKEGMTADVALDFLKEMQ